MLSSTRRCWNISALRTQRSHASSRRMRRTLAIPISRRNWQVLAASCYLSSPTDSAIPRPHELFDRVHLPLELANSSERWKRERTLASKSELGREPSHVVRHQHQCPVVRSSQ